MLTRLAKNCSYLSVEIGDTFCPGKSQNIEKFSIFHNILGGSDD